jgi:hypothetical protein
LSPALNGTWEHEHGQAFRKAGVKITGFSTIAMELEFSLTAWVTSNTLRDSMAETHSQAA